MAVNSMHLPLEYFGYFANLGYDGKDADYSLVVLGSTNHAGMCQRRYSNQRRADDSKEAAATAVHAGLDLCILTI